MLPTSFQAILEHGATEEQSAKVAGDNLLRV